MWELVWILTYLFFKSNYPFRNFIIYLIHGQWYSKLQTKQWIQYVDRSDSFIIIIIII